MVHNFYDILVETDKGFTYNPYAAEVNGERRDGMISIDFLNEYFSQYSTAEEMINAAKSEGLKLYFAWLRDKGILN